MLCPHEVLEFLIMAASLNRRAFLRVALAGAAASPWLLDPAWAKPSEALSVTRLTDDLVMISGAGANVVAARDAHSRGAS